jgi:hypothetical protein
MIYVCFAYGQPGFTPHTQDYECYDTNSHAWDSIHQRLRNWRDQDDTLLDASDPNYKAPILYPMTPQQLRNWFDGTVTFECHELGRSAMTGENICVILMSKADWMRECLPISPPTTYDTHEALDRVSMLMDMWSRFVCDAKAIQANRAWTLLAGNVEDSMTLLYKMIGEEHL